jgi:hypothetical protein
MAKRKKRKKRKIFQTAEERAAWEARSEENLRRLRYYMDRIRAELAAKGEHPRGLQYWIDRGRAELEARGELPPPA